MAALSRHLNLALAVLLITGCAPAGTANTTGSSAGGNASSSTPGTPPPSLSSGGRAQAPFSAEPTGTNPAWLPEDSDAALGVARSAMTDYARPGSDPDTWANDLARWLTPDATADYAGTDPATIPAHTVLGQPVLTTDPANGYGATATVQTNAGPYTVQLLRSGQGQPWKVLRITPQS
ncbi:MAG: hypothetical protein JWP57_4489 [Spirosoma sp.]|nr:hypothetical protein [Spirosoma sp.]